MHLVAIIGDHGDQWHRFPLIARSTTLTVLFLDHHMTPAARAEAARCACDPSAVTAFERLESDPCPVDCDGGVHPWAPVCEGPVTIAGRCLECGQVERIPKPIDLHSKALAHAN